MKLTKIFSKRLAQLIVLLIFIFVFVYVLRSHDWCVLVLMLMFIVGAFGFEALSSKINRYKQSRMNYLAALVTEFRRTHPDVKVMGAYGSWDRCIQHINEKEGKVSEFFSDASSVLPNYSGRINYFLKNGIQFEVIELGGFELPMRIDYKFDMIEVKIMDNHK